MKRKIFIFFASPGDLAEERVLLRRIVDDLNLGFGDGANVEFKMLGWEDNHALVGPRNQSVINEKIDRCDIFILAMHKRWGQEAPDAAPYSSYTEEEFHRAVACREKNTKPVIIALFKFVDPASESNPDPDLQRVMAFKKQLSSTGRYHRRHFEDSARFAVEIDRHLRDFAKGVLPDLNAVDDGVVLPVALVAKIEEENRKAREVNSTIAALDAAHLEMAEDAARLSKEGHIEFAHEKFSRLTQSSSNIRILYLAYEFFYRTGHLQAAHAAVDKWLALSGKDNDDARTADAYRSLGAIYHTRGDCDKAQEMYQRALEVNQRLNNRRGIAADYTGIGIVLKTRGNLSGAERYFKESLKINEELGDQKGVAYSCGNLGNVRFTLGAADEAEALFRRALDIGEFQEDAELMAATYGNLGNLYLSRHDFVHAKAMYEKALEYETFIGHKHGMANAYANLGALYQACGEPVLTQEMHSKAISLSQEIGNKSGLVTTYRNLGIQLLLEQRFDAAEEMFRKALGLALAIGQRSDWPTLYVNLAMTHHSRGNYELAKNLYLTALSFGDAVNSDTVSIYCMLGVLHRNQGDTVAARNMFEIARERLRELGLIHTLRYKEVETTIQELAAS